MTKAFRRRRRKRKTTLIRRIRIVIKRSLEIYRRIGYLQSRKQNKKIYKKKKCALVVVVALPSFLYSPRSSSLYSVKRQVNLFFALSKCLPSTRLSKNLQVMMNVGI
jgi:hypothetical protein